MVWDTHGGDLLHFAPYSSFSLETLERNRKNHQNTNPGPVSLSGQPNWQQNLGIFDLVQIFPEFLLFAETVPGLLDTS